MLSKVIYHMKKTKKKAVVIPFNSEYWKKLMTKVSLCVACLQEFALGSSCEMHALGLTLECVLCVSDAWF